jgi:flagellar biosynthesis/type III secretory pathway protein FliH
LANTPAGEDKRILEAVEAAERAGSVVSEQIRSIMEAAQAKADEIERQAQEEAARSRQESAEAARRLLEQIDEMEGHLSGLVQSLRQEADQLSLSLEGGTRD